MILVVLVLALASGAVTGFSFGRASTMPKERRLNAQLRTALKGLRPIANGISGNPQLDAQLALEDIDKKDN